MVIALHHHLRHLLIRGEISPQIYSTVAVRSSINHSRSSIPAALAGQSSVSSTVSFGSIHAGWPMCIIVSGWWNSVTQIRIYETSNMFSYTTKNSQSRFATSYVSVDLFLLFSICLSISQVIMSMSANIDFTTRSSLPRLLLWSRSSRLPRAGCYSGQKWKPELTQCDALKVPICRNCKRPHTGMFCNR